MGAWIRHAQARILKHQLVRPLGCRRVSAASKQHWSKRAIELSLVPVLASGRAGRGKAEQTGATQWPHRVDQADLGTPCVLLATSTRHTCGCCCAPLVLVHAAVKVCFMPAIANLPTKSPLKMYI